MSSPFVYTPHPSYMLTQYLDPAYGQQQESPFIPSASLYPTSPYANSNDLPNNDPGTPNTPRRVHFGDEFNDPFGTYARQRRPSWSGPPPHSSPGIVPVVFPPSSPFTPTSPFLGPQPQPPYYQRRHSYGAYGQQQPIWAANVPAWSPYAMSPGPAMLSPQWQAVQPTVLQIHPWLNGESPRGDFVFDLSAATYSPLRLVGPGQSQPIPWEDLKQSATHPPITRLMITCDMIPQWPIKLEFNPYFGAGPNGGHLPPHAAPPITVHDILFQIHQCLNLRISHIDWAKLSMAEEKAVSRAYAHRCRRSGTMEMIERGNGIKRVDFLLDKVFFKGLVRTGESWESMKLITG